MSSLKGLAGDGKERDLGYGSRGRQGMSFRSYAEQSTLLPCSTEEDKRSHLQRESASSPGVGSHLSFAICRTDC